MDDIDWPNLAAGTGLLESLDAAGADCCVRDRVEPREAGTRMPEIARAGMLDLRAFAAPEPLLRALEAADALRPGGCIELLTPMLPTPLLQMLAGRGFDARARMLDDGSACVRVRRP